MVLARSRNALAYIARPYASKRFKPFAFSSLGFIPFLVRLIVMSAVFVNPFAVLCYVFSVYLLDSILIF